MSENAFDAVVIGSGLGGLTAAALLAKAGRKVCVIERNHSVGGAASAFKKGALTIEPALHQTADPHHPGDPKHAILKELGLLDEIEWIPVEPFYSVKGGPVGEMFDMPVGFDAAHHALSQRFPKSRDGFARLLGAMEQIIDGVAELTKAGEERSLGKMLRARHGAAAARARLARLDRRDAGAASSATTRRPNARSARQSAITPTTPRHLAWPVFAMAQGGYLKAGGVFIKGGSRVLSMKLAKVVMKAGGSVLLGRDANGVDLDSRGPSRLRPACRREDQGRTSSGSRRKQVFANCAPHVLAHMLPDAERAKIEHAYLGQAAVDLAVLGAFRAQRPAGEARPRPLRRRRPARMGDLAQRDRRGRAALLRRSRRNRLPGYGIVNYGAIDSGLPATARLWSAVVGLDRFDNWAALSPQDEKDRRERWLDAFQAALDRDYPGFSAAVVERMFLNARSMAQFHEHARRARSTASRRCRSSAASGRACRARRGRRCPASISPRPSPEAAASAGRCGRARTPRESR